MSNGPKKQAMKADVKGQAVKNTLHKQNKTGNPKSHKCTIKQNKGSVTCLDDVCG